MSDPLVLAGGCQCGAVRFVARAANDEAYFCHCRMCQRAFGNVFACFVNVAKSDVTWEKGPPRFYASSKIARRGFCAGCGTPLSFEYNESARIDLAVGALDEPAKLRPVAHVGVESRVASFHEPGKLRELRVDDIEHIKTKWKAAYGERAAPGKPNG